MKIVDEKGRLFGKVNLIDLLVLLLVIAAAAALIWKTAGKKAAEHAAKPLRAVKQKSPLFLLCRHVRIFRILRNKPDQ